MLGVCTCPALNALISSLVPHNELLCSSVQGCTGSRSSVVLSQGYGVEEDVWFEFILQLEHLEEVPFWVSDLVRAPTVLWSCLAALLWEKEWVFLPKITKRHQDFPLFHSHDIAITPRNILNNKEDLLNYFFVKGSICWRVSLQTSLHLHGNNIVISVKVCSGLLVPT